MNTLLKASIILLIIIQLLFVAAQQLIAVMLTSTLSNDRFVCAGEIVIFTCTTRGSPILEWFSDEYIGTGGDRLQILSGSGRNTSSINQDAVATRINATNNDGVTVIVSELRIIASIKYPTATVSCSNGDPRSMQNITLRIFAVILNSTLNAEQVVHPQDIIIFTCTTRGSPILEWFSEEYIGTGGDRLQILSGSDRNTSSITSNAIATRISVTTENGITVIVSELRIIASLQYPTATVSCSNGSPKKNNLTFQTVERSTVNESAARFTQISTSTVGLSTDDVGDTKLNLAHIQLSVGAIIGIVASAVLVVLVASVLAIFLIIKRCKPVHDGSLAHGSDSANVEKNVTVATEEVKQDSLSDKLQGPKNQDTMIKASTESSEHQEKSKPFTTVTINQENTTISPRNKTEQIRKSTASGMSWDSERPSQKHGE